MKQALDTCTADLSTTDMHIVFLDKKTLGEVPGLEKFSLLGKVTYYETTPPSEVVARIADASVIVINKVVINDEIMAACPALKLICISATGTNNVDLQAAARRGVAVKNAVGYSTQSVTQHTFAMLFTLLSRLPYYDNYVKTGQYALSDIFTHYGPTITELSGKTFGIVGMGNIGKSVARVATAFGAHVIYYSTSGMNLKGEYPSVSFDELLTSSDIISIHAPLNERTKNLFTSVELGRMKKTAILINVGRGGIVNEADLAKVLKDNLIGGAGVDVFATEPMLSGNPLIHLANPEKVVLTPHNAWASVEARIKLMDIVFRNIEEYLKNRTNTPTSDT